MRRGSPIPDTSQMGPLRRACYTAAALASDAARGAYLTLADRVSFAELRALCLFIGYPRSGHSLVGSLLDAHPDAAIAHEQGVLRLVHARVPMRTIEALLVDNARRQVARGRIVGPYSYSVPGQWQGRVRTLRVIGDKHGEGVTMRLRARPWLLRRLREQAGVPVKLVHVTRNPFDIVATIEEKSPARDLAASAQHFLDLCETVERVRDDVGSNDWADVRHEAFVAAPREELARLCHFLRVVPEEGYLDACARIVFEKPRRSRDRVRWDARTSALLEQGIERHECLSGYSLDG